MSVITKRGPTEAPIKGAMSIIVPAFNEGLNIAPLTKEIFAQLKLAKIEGEVVIVDDNSRDGSVERVEELQKAGYNVRIIVRTTERGLSSAVLHGFENAKNDVLVCMDGDLQHDPKYLPALVAPIFSGAADFAVGSRKVEGGEIKDWPLHRHIISWTATMLARPLTPCADPMSGFFALRRSTLARKRNVNAMGFKIGLELLVRCGCRNIADVPIVFRDRERGESKLTVKQNIYYLLQLLQLYADAKPQYLAALAVLALTALYVLYKLLI